MGHIFAFYSNCNSAVADCMPDALAMKNRITKPAIAVVEELLQYRLPQSRKPLSAIVLTRDVAEQLVREWYALSTAADRTTDKGT